MTHPRGNPPGPAGRTERVATAPGRDAMPHALFHLGYASRCEHAVDPREERFNRARPTLRTDGPALVTLLG